MKKNILLSRVLKKIYGHTEEWRYDNPNFLFEENEIDEIVIGYCMTETGRYFRHCWCIKDGMLIDTSLEVDRFINLMYLPLFKIDKKNYEYCWHKASDHYYYDLDIQRELNFVIGLEKLTRANFTSIIEHQNKDLYGGLSSDAYFEVLEKYLVA